MKLLIYSDIHIEFAEYKPDLTHLDFDVVILAGDIAPGIKGVQWAMATFPRNVPVVYVAGNHEFYGSKNSIPQLYKKIKQAIAGTNIYFLENESVTIDGVQFLGCTFWTDFNLFWTPVSKYMAAESMNDYKKIRILTKGYRRLKPMDTIMMHHQSRLWLMDQMKEPCEKRVVVTHHAASIRSVAIEYLHHPMSAAYASNHDDLVRESGARLWVHGHTHSHSDYIIGKTRVVCNPRGYVGYEEVGFNESFVVEF